MPIRVLECYPAYQGEGSRIGNPVTFLRLAGCSVGCHWCDTKYSWKHSGGKNYTPEQVTDLVYTIGCPNLVITGGEPFEHPHYALDELQELWSPFHITHITWETSGAFGFNAGLSKTKIPTLISMAPKLPSAKTHTDFPELVPWFSLSAGNSKIDLQFKFVIDPRADTFLEDMNFIDDVIVKNLYDITQWPIIFTPVTHFDRTRDIVRNQVLDDLELLYNHFYDNQWNTWQPNFRILPQLHAVVYGSRKGV